MTRSDALIVLQARYGSKRLPGKALRRLEGQSLLARCLRRLLASGAAPVLLATTTRGEDDALVVEAQRCGVTAMRGSRDDVLKRFAMVAELVRPEYVIRATGDNPAVDSDAVARVLAALRAGVDYVVERGLPHGSAVEGVRTTALLDAAERAIDAYDREHVTPFLTRPENGYRIARPEAPDAVRRPDLRFTVDTADDFDWMARVFSRAGARAATLPLTDIIRAADCLAGWREVA
jgi:spore coat polysaccharide biosynthesis protein SpsF (cytidylyltransferase family)